MLDRVVNTVFLNFAVPILAVIAVFFTAQDLVPSYAALFHGGKTGVFTARDKKCGKSCSWRGDFVSDDGSVVRRDVLLGSGERVDGAGDRVKARDTGNRGAVYPAGWSPDAIWATFFLMLGLLVLGVWSGWTWRRLRRRFGRGPAGIDAG
ncbi:hypothetical protein [Actinomadura sp. WMMA1423]|uniref:hypothetical protein n=1 Tax=Actinomadura sp. WMMA1423 TaxID=2591108 RepID=UPI0011470241|nr:hypothetical protein [Actinomadura sp. WMMA1423]